MKIILNPGDKDPYHGVSGLIESIEERLGELNINYLTLPIDSEIIDKVKMINKMSKTENLLLLTLESQAENWSVNVARNADGRSRALAQILAMSAEKRSSLEIIKPRLRDVMYWEKKIPICINTSCPSVLIKNQISGNMWDLEETIVEGICNYLGIQYENN